MTLSTLQEKVIEAVFVYSFEDINKLEHVDRSILAFQAILSDYPPNTSQLAEFEIWGIKDEVIEARNSLNHQDPFTLFSLKNSNVASNNTTGTSADVRTYIKKITLDQINNKLEPTKQAITREFGDIGQAEQLFNLSPTLSAMDFKLVEMALTEPLCAKLKTATNLEEFAAIKNKIRESIILIPRADTIAKLMEMDEAQYGQAQRVINSLKTGHNDEGVEKLFSQFIRENKNIASLANRQDSQLQTIMLSLSPRLSPPWFIKDHPECRDLLVSLDDQQFAQVSYVLKEAETHDGLKSFIDHNSTQIDVVARMNNMELQNFQAAINNFRVLNFVKVHPIAVTLLQSMDASQSAKVEKSLDNEWVARLANEHPQLIRDFANFNEAQFTQITDIIANESFYKSFFAKPETLRLFADMEPNRFEIIKELFSATVVARFFDDNLHELMQIIKATDEERFFQVIQRISTENAQFCVNIVKAIPDNRFDQFMPTIQNAMMENPRGCVNIIESISGSKFDQFKPTIKAVMSANPSECYFIIGRIPDDKLDQFMPEIQEAMIANVRVLLMLMRRIPADQFKPMIQAVMSANPSECANIIKAIPADKFDQFKPTIQNAMIANPSECVNIIKAIPADKFDQFKPTIKAVMSENPSECVNIIKAIPADKFDPFIPDISFRVTNLIKEGSGGRIEDSSKHWDDVQDILKSFRSSDQRVAVVDEALKDISDVNSKARLVSFLNQEEQKALANTKLTNIKSSALKAMYNAAALTDGNSNVQADNNYGERSKKSPLGNIGKW